MTPSHKQPGFSSKRLQLYLVCFALVAFTAVAYWNIDKATFSDFDDPTYVYKNTHLAEGFSKAGITWAFTSFYASNWHPVTWLSYMLDYQLYGIKPAGYHLTNLILHLLNALLLFLLLRSMTGAFWRSALVAALFALHPMHVESVAWVSERKDVLSAFFMFTAFLCYSSFVHNRRNIGFYVATFLFFVLGLMAKPMIVTFPFVLLLCDFWPFRRFGLNADQENIRTAQPHANRFIPVLLEKIPFFLLSLFSCVITLYAQRAGGAIVKANELSFFLRSENSIFSVLRYVQKMLWPSNLGFFYPVSMHPSPLWKVSLALITIVLISIVAMVRMKKQPYLLVGWLWFLGTLAPVIGLVQVGSQALADRYGYIPLIGLFIIIAWFLHDISRHSRLSRITALSCSCAVLVILMLQTRVQAGFWKNDLVLSEHALSLDKNNFLAWSMKGHFLYASGDYDNALRCYAQSLSLCPTQVPPRMNIGCMLLSQGRTRESIAVFKELFAIDSMYSPAYLNCGKAYALLRNNDSAILCFSRALAIEPLSSPALYDLGRLYEAKEDFQKSMGYFLRACRVNPNDPGVFFELGNCCLKSKRPEEAAQWYEKSISLDHSFVFAHRQLAIALDSCGRHDSAKTQISIADSLAAAANMRQKKTSVIIYSTK